MATSLVEFSATHTEELLGNTIAIIDDVKLYFLLIMGVFIGFIILEKIIRVITEK